MNISIDSLTIQERKVLLLIANGYKSQQIADVLFISTHTVKNHKSNICKKLQLKSTTELLCYAVKYSTILDEYE
ncbi:response regulator transcription factor [Pseudarcicella hirudinis]|uniref:response regulator transcription factor n=1 Tax=Pseudarcicella hirudinis TaxID=1079859 RepID=UPI000B863E7D